MTREEQFDLYRMAYKRAGEPPAGFDDMTREELIASLRSLLAKRKTRRGGLGYTNPETTCPVTGEPRQYPNAPRRAR